jgi:hypothetical protein
MAGGNVYLAKINYSNPGKNGSSSRIDKAPKALFVCLRRKIMPIVEWPGENGLGTIPVAKPGSYLMHGNMSETLQCEEGDLPFMGGSGPSIFRGTVPGLTFTMGRNTLVDSKRLRRFFNLAYIYSLNAPRVKWVDEVKLWDGAGRISRRWAMQCELFGTDSQRLKYRHDLKTAGRFQFTYTFSEGMAKGHLLVTDDDVYDLWLPKDIKPQVQYAGHYLTLAPVHANKGPFVPLDLQSMINLPVFTKEKLVAYARQTNEQWIDALKNGKLGQLFPPEDNLDYPPMKFIASGGNPMWFPSIVRSLGNTWVRHLTAMSGAMRANVPGIVVYVCSESAYRDKTTLLDGECLVDLDKAALVISDLEWERVMQIMGGGDSDDAVVCIMNSLCLTAWRRPNQAGEYFQWYSYKIIGKL